MRRIFEQLPYFLPAEPAPFARLFLTEGIRREVAKGELLKRGGESQRLFFLESGLCAYYAAEAENHRPTILSVLLPGRAMGDLTASVGTRCNVFTRALEKSVVRVVPPAVLTAALMKDPALAQLEIRSVIAKEESILEGMTANFIRPPAERCDLCQSPLPSRKCVAQQRLAQTAAHDFCRAHRRDCQPQPRERCPTAVLLDESRSCSPRRAKTAFFRPALCRR